MTLNAEKFQKLNEELISWKDLEDNASNRVQARASIIIPTFNQLELTEQCVDSIQKETIWNDVEIILIDNGSAQVYHDELASLSARWSNVQLVTNPENLMFSLGNNVGASKSTGNFLVFLNNDTKVTSGWLTELLKPLIEDSQIGQVGAKLLYEDDSVQGTGFVCSRKSKIPYFLHAKSPSDASHVNQKREFQAVSGACCAMRADEFFTTRGFDCGYINGCEDLDLSFKVRFELKKKVLHNPESVVYHLESMTEGRWVALQHNRARFVEKWGDKVVADDSDFYDADGIRVVGYEKHGDGPDGDTAVYVPIFETKEEN